MEKEIPFKDLPIGGRYKSLHQAKGCIFEKTSNDLMDNCKLVEGTWVGGSSGRVVMSVGEIATAADLEPVVVVT